MRTGQEVTVLLWNSLGGSDRYIFVAAIFALILYVVTIVATIMLEKSCNSVNSGNTKNLSGLVSVTRVSIIYNLFITMITIFPLLGMLGTVFGLLGLDLASGDMENIKNNFFIALTSTAWGIIFSVIFKLLHAVVSEWVEYQLEVAKKISKEKKQ